MKAQNSWWQCSSQLQNLVDVCNADVDGAPRIEVMHYLVPREFRPECVDDAVLETFTRTCFPDTDSGVWPTMEHVEALSHCSAETLVRMSVFADFLDMPTQFTQLLHYVKSRLTSHAHMFHQKLRQFKGGELQAQLTQI